MKTKKKTVSTEISIHIVEIEHWITIILCLCQIRTQTQSVIGEIWKIRNRWKEAQKRKDTKKKREEGKRRRKKEKKGQGDRKKKKDKLPSCLSLVCFDRMHPLKKELFVF